MLLCLLLRCSKIAMCQSQKTFQSGRARSDCVKLTLSQILFQEGMDHLHHLTCELTDNERKEKLDAMIKQGNHESACKSIRCGTALAIFLKCHSTPEVMILSFWSSNAFLVCIRPQVLQWTNHMSADMESFDSFLDLSLLDTTAPSDPCLHCCIHTLDGHTGAIPIGPVDLSQGWPNSHGRRHPSRWEISGKGAWLPMAAWHTGPIHCFQTLGHFRELAWASFRGVQNSFGGLSFLAGSETAPTWKSRGRSELQNFNARPPGTTMRCTICGLLLPKARWLEVIFSLVFLHQTHP